MKRRFSIRELRNRILGAGQNLPAKWDRTGVAADVWPKHNMMVTIGLYTDPTLISACRVRYFVCLQDSPRNRKPIVQWDPAFALRKPFPSAVDLPGSISGFMGGPFCWVLHRLRRFRELLLWPASAANQSGVPTLETLEAYLDMPKLRRRLRGHSSLSSEIGALALELSRPSDAAVLWEVACSVPQILNDWLVSDTECAEVYRLHHHDKVIASIPDPKTRKEMLQELRHRADLFEDCSGY